MNIRMIVLAAAAVALSLATGCGKSKLVDESEALRDEMCKCKDAECASGVMDKVKAFDGRNTGTKVTKGDNEAIKASMMRADECAVEAARGQETPKAPVVKPADKPTEKPPEKPVDKPEPDTDGDADGTADGDDNATATTGDGGAAEPAEDNKTAPEAADNGSAATDNETP